MDMHVLEIIEDRCTGCRICEQWCSWQHHGTVSPGKTRIKVVRLYREYKNLPVTCHQCTKAPCITSCRFDALSRNPVTGAVLVHQEACTGCRRCIRACPHGAIRLDVETKTVLICDLCGGEPQCAARCPAGAIGCVPRHAAGTEKRMLLAQQLAEREAAGR